MKHPANDDRDFVILQALIAYPLTAFIIALVLVI